MYLLTSVVDGILSSRRVDTGRQQIYSATNTNNFIDTSPKQNQPITACFDSIYSRLQPSRAKIVGDAGIIYSRL